MRLRTSPQSNISGGSVGRGPAPRFNEAADFAAEQHWRDDRTVSIYDIGFNEAADFAAEQPADVERALLVDLASMRLRTSPQSNVWHKTDCIGVLRASMRLRTSPQSNSTARRATGVQSSASMRLRTSPQSNIAAALLTLTCSPWLQ